MTANRPWAPESKLGVWERWPETVYLPSCQGLQLRHLYEAMETTPMDHSGCRAGWKPMSKSACWR
jgi:hypothetical protein